MKMRKLRKGFYLSWVKFSSDGGETWDSASYHYYRTRVRP